MGQKIKLSSEFDAYESAPTGSSKGGVIILQEIFGVNQHIREVVDRYASLGFHAIAPALFDPAKKNVELSYDDEGRKEGIELMKKVKPEMTYPGIRQAIDHLHKSEKNVSLVGYCWGGSLAFLAAVHSQGLYKSVSYYGSMVPEHKDEHPKVPMMFHFGEADKSIPPDKIQAIEKAQPTAKIYVYAANHAFNCDKRENYSPSAARLAEERTLKFLTE